ncbi:spore germination protein Q [Paenibacillus uliginis N3/975]|uniref:Spore germination protein Q n=1 Tax=Paenibacillus uliginis N3/975 TaxID=1313296 RepID=A0A1X7HHZ7_9BACL|nr:spore coat protein GerQ [Paenibacillus uliginis]SMF86094.1 spore germination protein Q [Paenibacillus uliginis N3/975]
MLNHGNAPVNYTIGNGYPGIQQGFQQGFQQSGHPQQSRGMAPNNTKMPPQVMSGAPMTPTGQVIQAPPQFEQSYIENILRLNLGKQATFYMTYENNSQWNAKIFTGVIEAAGRDHIIISEPQTGRRIILLMVNLDYVVFNEPLTYQYPGVAGTPPMGR